MTNFISAPASAIHHFILASIITLLVWLALGSSVLMIVPFQHTDLEWVQLILIWTCVLICAMAFTEGTIGVWRTYQRLRSTRQ